MVKVSVFMISYNHEKFIGQAIESIVSQKTNFPFQLVISDDCSPDGTRAICERYQAMYPAIINLLPAGPNLGPIGNTLKTLEACTGGYVAFCEGDDYWTSPYKLQKQVDFLDANPDYSLCFSPVDIVTEEGVRRLGFNEFKKDTYTIEDFILASENIVPTPSMMIRNLLPRPFPAFLVEAVGGDRAIQLLIADKGKAKLLNEELAAYRNQAGGMTKSPEIIREWRESLLKMYHSANTYFNYKYQDIFNKKFAENAKWGLLEGAAGKTGLNRFKNYLKYMPEYVKYSPGLDIKELVYLNLAFFVPSLLKKIKG